MEIAACVAMNEIIQIRHAWHLNKIITISKRYSTEKPIVGNEKQDP